MSLGVDGHAVDLDCVAARRAGGVDDINKEPGQQQASTPTASPMPSNAGRCLAFWFSMFVSGADMKPPYNIVCVGRQ